MNIADVKDWADILSKLAMPFLLAWVGLLLLRQAEERKAGISRSSDFKKRWADDFYDSSHEFMSSTERYMSALNQLQEMKDPNGTFGSKLQQELNDLNVRLGELHLRIQRLAYFAPNKGPAAVQAATDVQDYLGQLVRNMQGSFDVVISLQSSFNKAVRDAHAEMLDFE